MRRVVVTGLGAITPLGLGVRRTWSRLIAGDCAISSLPHSESSERWRGLPATVAGLVPEGITGDKSKWNALDWVEKGEERRMAKFAQYAVAATEMAFEDAHWRPTTQLEKEGTGICLGSGIGNLEELYDTSVAYHEDGYKKVSPLFVPKLLINLAAGHVSMKYGLEGLNHAVTTACTTGAHAIGDASRFIAFGDADVIIAGGSESCIHPLAFAGFARSRSLTTAYNNDPVSASRPFDRDRSGFVIAEGAALMVLEELEHAKSRGAKIYAELVGYGCSGDAYHTTAPREDGRGAFLAMQRALKHAQIRPKHVDYINAHATSTPLGDAAENAAITTLMTGEDGKGRVGEVSISSTKGAVGHLLGAAGSLEAIFAVMAIKEKIMPPTLNLHNVDSNFKCNYVPLTAQEKTVNVAITNSFGFGGTNASLAFSKYE